MMPSSAGLDRPKNRTAKDWQASVYSLMRRIFPGLSVFFCMLLLPFISWMGIPSPFAAAFLVSRREKPDWFCLLGLGASLLLRCLWGLYPDWWQFTGCGLLWLLFQRWYPKPGLACAWIVGAALSLRAVGEFCLGTLWKGIVATAAIPAGMLAACILRQGFEQWKECCAQPRARERTGLHLLLLLLISALGFFRIGAVNLGHLCALTATMLAASVNGSAYGAAAGLLTGLMLVMGGHDLQLLFPLCVSGFGCGLPAVNRRLPLGCVVVMLAWLLTGSLSPTPTFPLHWMTAVAASLIFLLLPRSLREQLPLYLNGAMPGQARHDCDFISQRIAHIQEAVRQLAQALPTENAELLTDGEALAAMLCTRCVNRELCWGQQHSHTEKWLDASMEHARIGDAPQAEPLPAIQGQPCLRMEDVERTAQRALVEQEKSRYQHKKAAYRHTLTLTHLAALSGTLGSLSALAAGESVSDLQAAHVIRLAIDELRLPARLCYARRVDGRLQVALEMESLLPGQPSLEGFLQHLSTMDGLDLSISRVEKKRVELEETPVYTAVVGNASLCAGGDEDAVCGDACLWKRCEGGRMLLMICDGMGHGESAHQQSQKTLELLTLLLEAGYTRSQAIMAVNGIMLGVSHNHEHYSTLDLCEVDLWTGMANCEKLGACATWVVRGERLKKVEASSLPLGILEEAQPSQLQHQLHSGDILLLMSDGVSDAFRDEEDLRHAILESLYIQPQRMADALIRSALLAGGDTPRDDMTVLVLMLLDRQHAQP